MPARDLRLPTRYQGDWATDFWRFVHEALSPGVTILDVGSGRTPTIAISKRPPGSHYVGLDMSCRELRSAPAGSYDEVIVADVEIQLPQLAGRFDLIVSWLVFEHIQHLDRAAAALNAYVKPGGWCIAGLAGRNAVFAIANRLLPSAVGARVVARLRERQPETVFPTHYDHCTDRGLRKAFGTWEELQIVPLWHAADYFDRLPRLKRFYLGYENWVARRRATSLCTHYVLAARKGNP
jgi:SAM-dependent methyltransferase